MGKAKKLQLIFMEISELLSLNIIDRGLQVHWEILKPTFATESRVSSIESGRHSRKPRGILRDRPNALRAESVA